DGELGAFVEGGGGEEVGGVAGIWFNCVAGCAIIAAGNDDAFGFAGVGVADEFGDVVEDVHELHGHGDVGPGGLSAVEVDPEFVAGEGGGHEDGGEELGGFGGAEAEKSAGESVGVDGDG